MYCSGQFVEHTCITGVGVCARALSQCTALGAAMLHGQQCAGRFLNLLPQAHLHGPQQRGRQL
jgi:hypothetical protein